MIEPTDELIDVLLGGISVVFASLGRGILCLDRDLRVRHAGPSIDQLVGPDAAKAVIGRPVAELLGEELLGSGGSLAQALERGSRREGWGAVLTVAGFAPRQVSITVAPAQHPADAPYCDPQVHAFVVIRPLRETPAIHRDGTTVFAGLVARSAAMGRLFQLIESLDHSDATVLISGESGTGKELIAKALHDYSPRSAGPFVAVNCAAIPGELLESELFGHVRGAFTGAIADREGRFAAARSGTLFLDEIGDLPLPLQVKLLRVLQERSFERVGDNRPQTSDARIIAATHVDLPAAVAAGRFREDLYYRLRVIPLVVPPLRDRPDDIAPLADFLLDRIAGRTGRTLRLGPGVHRALLAYHWPGNVRELENALAYAEAVATGDTLQVADLPVEVRQAGERERIRLRVTPTTGEAATAPTGDEAADERQRLVAALQSHQWNRQATAQALGMSRSTLWRKMREYGL